MKEGVGSDYENKDKILPLLLFESSHDPKELTTLGDYVGRMKPEQKEILYLTGESRKVIENSPHLESVRQKGYEVLYLSDPVDELWFKACMNFRSTNLSQSPRAGLSWGLTRRRSRQKNRSSKKRKNIRASWRRARKSWMNT